MEIISEEPRLDPFNVPKVLWQIALCSKGSLRRFGIIPTLKTAQATLSNVARQWLTDRKARRFEPGITLITFTIHPDMARIWGWFAARVVDPSTTIVLIVDCSGLLRPTNFPRAKVVRFCNCQHGRKIDYWIYHGLSTKYVWLSDDDVIPISTAVWEHILPRFEEDPTLAAVSLRPRGWELEWNGTRQRCMGPYSLVFDRERFCSEELSFRWVKTTDERIALGRSPGRFDVADYAHLELMRSGYRVEINGTRAVAGFVGVSRALVRMLETRGKVREYIFSQMRENPNHALGEIEAQYCSCLVKELYMTLFQEQPRVAPPLSRDELLELAAKISGSFWTDPISRLTRWDGEYSALLKIAKGEG